MSALKDVETLSSNTLKGLCAIAPEENPQNESCRNTISRRIVAYLIRFNYYKSTIPIPFN